MVIHTNIGQNAAWRRVWESLACWQGRWYLNGRGFDNRDEGVAPTASGSNAMWERSPDRDFEAVNAHKQ
ncbi:MAG TPA: hypothetical protein DCZ48_05920 [Methylococcaceae bacterium]|nr:hypothetical protein [Methylococcaceae bacterium]